LHCCAKILSKYVMSIFEALLALLLPIEKGISLLYAFLLLQELP
jgi:hypothetical protein